MFEFGGERSLAVEDAEAELERCREVGSEELGGVSGVDAVGADEEGTGDGGAVN